MSKYLKKSIISTFLALLSLLIVTFAWFTGAYNAGFGFGGTVIDKFDDLIDLSFVGEGGETLQDIKLNLLPNEKYQLKINLENKSDMDISLKVSFIDVKSHYLSEEIITSYYESGPFIDMKSGKKIISYLSGGQMIPLDNNYYLKFRDSFINAIKYKIYLENETKDYNNLEDINVNEQIKDVTIAKHSSVALFVDFYFNPYKYKVVDDVMLLSSAPYLNQEINLTIKLNN